MAQNTTAYDQRQAIQKEQLLQRAAKLRTEGTTDIETARDFFYQLNGQPTLPGHHSYKADVNRRKRHNNIQDRGYNKLKEADKLQRRANAIGTAGVASDDPNAITQLQSQLEYINTERDEIKKVNAIVRKHCPKYQPGDTWPEPAATIVDALTDAGFGYWAQQAIKINYMGKVGIESFELSNRTASARRIQQRIDDLTEMNKSQDIEAEWNGTGWHMWIDQTAGRIYLEIDDRLTRESFTAIRSQGGFNWSRRDNWYLRKITPNALRAVRRLADNLDELIEYLSLIHI